MLAFNYSTIENTNYMKNNIFTFFKKHWPTFLALFCCGIITIISILLINIPTGFINKKLAADCKIKLNTSFKY